MTNHDIERTRRAAGKQSMRLDRPCHGRIHRHPWHALGASALVLALAACGGGGGGGDSPDVPGTHWTTSRERSIGWNAVGYANGTFVAVGEDGGVARSTDGVTWTVIDTQEGEDWVGVAYGGSSWVALGQGGQVATSTDGATWTHGSPLFAPGDADATAMSQLAFGGGRFVAVGDGGSWAGGDGRTWSPADRGVDGIAYGNGVFVGARPDGLYLSADGAHWDLALALDPTTVLKVESVAFGGGQFVASDFAGRTYASADGRQWTSQASTFHGVGWRLDFADGAFWTGLGDTVYASLDAGASWTLVPQPADTGLRRFAASPQAFVSASGSGVLWSGPDASGLVARTPARVGNLAAVDYVDGRILVGADTGVLTAAPDQSSWPTSQLIRQGLLVVVPQSFAHDANGVVVAVGYCYDMAGSVVHLVARSTNAVDWTIVDVGARYDGVLHAARDGRRFVMADSLGRIFASTDGSAWTQLATVSPPGDAVAGPIATGGGRYVLVGTGGFAAASTDAVHWTVAPTVSVGGAPLALHGIAWDGRVFVAVGDGGMVATSADGLTWTVAASASTEPLYAVLVSSGGNHVAAGAHGAIETSPDAVHWTVRSTRASQSLYGLGEAAGSLYAVGQDGFIQASSR
jgi:hypothetical protein